jgi:16S rRNA C967 or C1407 C5-methylase (RsmB/RsmF family)
MKFPSVQKIVYSTCSVHVMENEHVVFAALKSKEAIKGGFILAPKAEVIPTWPRRGLEAAASNDGEREPGPVQCKLRNPLTLFTGALGTYRGHA